MPPFQFQAYEPRYTGTIGDLMQAPARARAQALRESGAAQARAAEIGGQASATAATAVNTAVSGTLGAYMQYAQNAPAREAAALDLKKKHLEVDAATRAADEERQLRALFAAPDPKPEDIYRVVGPQRGSEIVKGLTALRTESQKNFGSTQQLVGSMTGAILALPEGLRPEAYATARQNLLQRGVVQPTDIPPEYDPAFLQQAHLWALTPDKQQDVLNPKPIEVNGSLVRPGADGQLTTVYTAPETPAQTETARHNQELERIAALTAGRQEETAKETARHNRATEAAAAAGDAAVNLTPEATDIAAKQWAMTGVLVPTGTGPAGAKLRTKIMNRGGELYAGLDLASQKAAYDASRSSLTALQKQRDAMGAFEATAKKNLDVFLAQASQVTDTGAPFLNRPLRAIDEKILGAPTMAAFNTARRTVIPEFAKILANPGLSGQLSDSARKEVEDVVSGDATFAQTLAAARVLVTDVANRTQSYDDQIKAIQDRIAKVPGAAPPTETPAGASGADPLGILK